LLLHATWVAQRWLPQGTNLASSLKPLHSCNSGDKCNCQNNKSFLQCRYIPLCILVQYTSHHHQLRGRHLMPCPSCCHCRPQRQDWLPLEWMAVCSGGWLVKELMLIALPNKDAKWNAKDGDTAPGNTVFNCHLLHVITIPH